VYLRGQVLPDDAESVNEMLARYPDAANARIEAGDVKFPTDPTDPRGVGIGVMWPELSPELVPPYPHARAAEYGEASEHWLVPGVGDESDRLSPLLLWWALLFGLSLLARYQPAEWRKALDLDRSQYADPLTALLDEALGVVPDLLYEAAVLE
jgi:hypothetical protein